MNYSDYEFLIVFDRNKESISKVRSQGCKIIQYLALEANLIIQIHS